MNHTINNLCLDLLDRASSILLPIPQRDTARTLQIRLTQGGIPYPIPEDAFAVLTAKAPSGSAFPWIRCHQEGEGLRCPIPGSHTVEAGMVRCQLRLYSAADDSLLLTAPEFTLEITPQVCDAADDSGVAPAPNALDALVSKTLEAADLANAAAQQVLSDAESGKFQGEKGEKGEKGDTPVNGVDYFTCQEKQKFLESIREDLNFAIVTVSVTSKDLHLTDAAHAPFPEMYLDTTGVKGPIRVTVTGKNLFDRDKVNASVKGEGTTLHMTAGGYQYDIYTGNSGSNHAVTAENLAKLPMLPEGSYTLSYRRLSDSGYVRVFRVAEDGTVTALNTETGDGPWNFSLPEASRITLRRSSNTAMTVEDLQIELGEVATTYAPYQAQEATVEAEEGGVLVMPPLHGYHPNTTVTTAPAVPIHLTYIVHTQSYLEQKFDLITLILKKLWENMEQNDRAENTQEVIS